MRKLPPLTGIYQIRCISTGKIYIGSAVNIHERWRQRRAALKHNKHGNYHLQNAWNKYGAVNFEFSVLELVDKTNL